MRDGTGRGMEWGTVLYRRKRRKRASHAICWVNTVGDRLCRTQVRLQARFLFPQDVPLMHETHILWFAHPAPLMIPTMIRQLQLLRGIGRTCLVSRRQWSPKKPGFLLVIFNGKSPPCGGIYREYLSGTLKQSQVYFFKSALLLLVFAQECIVSCFLPVYHKNS